MFDNNLSWLEKEYRQILKENNVSDGVNCLICFKCRKLVKLGKTPDDDRCECSRRTNEENNVWSSESCALL